MTQGAAEGRTTGNSSSRDDGRRWELFTALAYDVGRMLGLVAVAMATLVVVAVVFDELLVVPAVLLATAVTGGVAGALVVVGEPNERPSRAYGMLAAASGWLVVAMVGALPFLTVAWTVRLFGPTGAATATAPFLHPTNAVFESMSGFTGTGLTVAPSPSRLPHVLQWWRSTTEWVGGIGVIVLTTAVLSRPGSGSLTLYEGDARSERLHFEVLPRLRTIVGIFSLFTVGSVVLLLVVGLPPWAALNDAMTGLSTGGFSVTDGSIGAYHDPLVALAFVPVMTLGSIAFPVHYLLLRGDLRAPLRDVQTRWFVGLVVSGTLALTGVLLVTQPALSPGSDAVASLFQFVSALSCTGFSTVSVGSLSGTTKLLVVLPMIVGGSAGSTVGGIKLIRLVTLAYGTRYRVRGTFYPPDVVRPFRVGNRLLTDAQAALEIEEAALVSFLWAVFLVVGVLVLQAVFLFQGDPHSLVNVTFDVVSAQGNVGLSTGVVTPGLPTAAKLMLVGNMWIGRLEIIPVAVFLRALVTGLDVA